MRDDGWENAVTGLGTARDKRIFTNLFLRPYPLETYHALWKGDGISGAIVEAIPEGVMREGYEGPSEKLREKAASLGFDKAFFQLMCQGRAYGGAIMLLGIQDGRMPFEPVGKVRDVTSVYVITHRRVQVMAYEQDPRSPEFGKPLLYSITGAGPRANVTTLVHASRVLRWDGLTGDEFDQEYLDGWSWSVLHRPFETVRDIAGSSSALASLLQDANQAVYYMKDLIQQAVSDPDSIRTRMQQVDLYRSVMRALILDADSEKFERTTTNFTGVGEVLQMLFSLLAAQTRIPQTVLLGRSPAGMNATGESDTRLWYDLLRNGQPDAAAEMDRFYKLLDPNAEPVCFRDPMALDDFQEEDLKTKKATRLKLEIDAQILTETEAAIFTYGTEEEIAEVEEWIRSSRMAELKAPKEEAVDEEEDLSGGEEEGGEDLGSAEAGGEGVRPGPEDDPS